MKVSLKSWKVNQNYYTSRIHNVIQIFYFSKLGNEIDGESLILLNDDVASFKLNIGPASKLRVVIETLRQQQKGLTGCAAGQSKVADAIIVNQGSGTSLVHTPNLDDNKVCAYI